MIRIARSERQLCVLVILVTALVTLGGGGAPTASAASCTTPAFGARTTFGTAGAPEALATADLNGDGKLDAVTADFTGNSISVLLGDGVGGFGVAANVPTGGRGPEAVATGFLNGDAAVDVVVANQASNNVSVLLGDGSGGFAAPATFGADNQPVDVAIADFNLDGKADIAYAALFNSVGVLDGDGGGGFAAARTLMRNGNPADVGVGDFDGDGAADLAVPRIAESEIQIFFNKRDRTGTFFTSRVPLAESATAVAVADLNHDGRPDLAFNQGDRVGVAMVKAFTQGSGSPFEAPVTFPVGALATDVAAGDVTGDGNLDLVVPTRTDDNVSILAGDGAGGFAPPVRFPAGDFPEGVGLADLDANGSLDILVAISGENALSALKNACAIGPVDLQVTGIEVTQGIQDVANSVGLVANRRTVARVHVRANSTIDGVTARLSATGFGGTSLGSPLWPSNPGAELSVRPAPERGRINESFLFTLPPGWTTGTVTLRAEINPFQNPIESTYANNTMSVTQGFTVTKALKIRIVKYVYRDDKGQTHRPTDGDVEHVESLLRRQLPISKLSVTHTEFVDGGAPFSAQQIVLPNSSGGGDVGEMLRRMTAWRQTFEPSNTGEIYLGLVDNRGGGIADGIPGWNTVTQDTSAVHEVGHLLGRRHVRCTGDEGGPDPAYPYPGGLIGGPAADPARFFGFDVGDAALAFPALPRVVPNTVGDEMSYCQNTWFSDYNYTGIRSYIDSTFTAVDPVGDFLSVVGKVDAAGQAGALSFVARTGQVGEIPPRVAGPFHIRLYDGVGGLLADYPFTPVPDLEGTAGASFAHVVDFVPGTRRVAIRSDAAGADIASAKVSATPPVVSLTAPSGGTLPATGDVAVDWTADDADGDAVRASILYSRDGGATWRTLAASVPGSSYTVDAKELEGTRGTSSGRLRIVASDGVLTASSESGPLDVGGKAPDVLIHEPLDGSTWVRGQGIPLEASAVDVEDGTLDGAEIAWTSDRDGALGTGRLLEPTALTPGRHILTAAATDRDGRTTTRGVTVHVVGKLPPGSVPAANAGADRQGLEGDTITLDGTGSSDADGDALTYGWTQIDGPAVSLEGPASAPSFVALDDGIYRFRLTVTDGRQGSASDDVTITVANAAPKVVIASPTAAAVLRAGSVRLTATFRDAGPLDTHQCRILWDDENGSTPATGTVREAGSGTGTCAGSRTLPAGVYRLRIRVFDDEGAEGADSVVIVVYDPTAGRVVGVGTISAPTGSYPADPGMAGPAAFVVLSAYPPRRNKPRGVTVLTFPRARFLFTSVHQRWLAVSGFRAQFQGTGKVNGRPGYTFRVTVADERRPKVAGTDRFRIKVWNTASGAVIFDNVMGAPDTLSTARPEALASGAVAILR